MFLDKYALNQVDRKKQYYVAVHSGFRAINLLLRCMWCAICFGGILLSITPARAIAKGYATTDSGLRSGMVVSLVSSSGSAQSTVTRATRDNQAKVVGIATMVHDQLLAVGSSRDDVYIQDEGTIRAYVSDIDGAPKRGDVLSMSPVAGVLMKGSASTYNIAVAESDFEAKTAESYHLLNGSAGSTRIGLVEVNLDGKGLVSLKQDRSQLGEFANKLTGKNVSDVRVLVSLAVFLLVLFVEGVIIYGAVSSAIRSVGRNPLAKTAITKELFRVGAIASAVLLFGVLAVYALLWI